MTLLAVFGFGVVVGVVGAVVYATFTLHAEVQP